MKIRIIFFISLLFFLGCQHQYFETFTIISDGEFSNSECLQKGIKDSIVMIESKYCGHCKATKPIFIEACKNSNVEPEILDISIEKHRDKMKSYGIEVQYTPTFIIGCKYFIGAKNKTEYIKLIGEIKK